MAMTIGFDTVQDYLTQFAKLGSIGSSPHKAFWKSKIVGGSPVPITYSEFVDGVVPHVLYRGRPIPIIWKDAPLLSPLFLILAEPGGFAGKPQMIPFGDQQLTNLAVVLTLSDGSTISGPDALENLETWLKNGFPENPGPIA